MKNFSIISLAVIGAFLFSGCVSGPRVQGVLLTKSGVVTGLNSFYAVVPTPKESSYSGYKNIDNTDYKCSTLFTLHAMATKSLENGYPYFSVIFPKGSNVSPLAINSVDKMVKYCTPTYYDKESNFLDDKCSHIGLGQGTPSYLSKVKAYFYKKRNPFVPLYTASKIIRESEKELISYCWNNDIEGFRKALTSYGRFGTTEE